MSEVISDRRIEHEHWVVAVCSTGELEEHLRELDGLAVRVVSDPFECPDWFYGGLPFGWLVNIGKLKSTQPEDTEEFADLTVAVRSVVDRILARLPEATHVRFDTDASMIDEQI